MNAKRISYILVSLFISSIFTITFFIFVSTQSSLAHAKTMSLTPAASNRFVSLAGNDKSNNCTDAVAPCRTVQHAIYAAQPGDDIFVASGTYTGTMQDPTWNGGVTATVIITKNISSLRGGFSPDFTLQDSAAYPTILSAGSYSGTFVLLINNTGPLIEGFTLTGADGPHNEVTNFFGGGIRIQGGSPTISNNIIQDNYTLVGGAGIYITDGAVPLIKGNTIISNTSGSAESYYGGGGILINNASPTVISNTIAYNQLTNPGHGAGIFILKGTVDLQGNQIMYNKTPYGGGGGIAVIDNSEKGMIEIHRNKIVGNTSTWGGGVSINNIPNLQVMVDANMILDNYSLIGGPNAGGITIDHITPTVKIINNVIAGNEFGGVEGSNFHKIILLNNTLVNNGNRGIAMFAWPDPPTHPITATITNNIIMGHPECGITGFYEVTILVNFNDFWSNATDFCTIALVSKNINADPQFIDPSKDDYHISYGSPAMNVGTNQGAPLTDLDGMNRPQMKIVDMGAFEVIGYILNLPLVTK